MRGLIPALALGLALGGCGATAETDATFGQKVRAYLLAHPEVMEEALAKLQETRTAAAATEGRKLLTANRAAIERDARDPVIGRRDAPITVTEFFDYRCGFCKVAAPEVLKLVAENPDVRFVMKEMPILADSATGTIGVSRRAALLGLAANADGKYVSVHRALMRERALDAAAVDRIAAANGIPLSRLEDPALAAHLDAVQTLAATLQISGTPAFLVGDITIAGADMASLRAAITAQRAARSKTVAG